MKGLIFRARCRCLLPPKPRGLARGRSSSSGHSCARTRAPRALRLEAAAAPCFEGKANGSEQLLQHHSRSAGFPPKDRNDCFAKEEASRVIKRLFNCLKHPAELAANNLWKPFSYNRDKTRPRKSREVRRDGRAGSGVQQLREPPVLLLGERLVHPRPSLGPLVQMHGAQLGAQLLILRGDRALVQVFNVAQLKQLGRGGRAMPAPSAGAGPLPLQGPSARNPRHPGRGRGGFFVPLLGTSSTWSCRLHSQKFFSYFLIKSRAKSKPSLPLTHPPLPPSLKPLGKHSASTKAN